LLFVYTEDYFVHMINSSVCEDSYYH